VPYLTRRGRIRNAEHTAAKVAFCWGINQWGFNGNGTLAGSDVPVKVNGNISFSIVSTGILGLHTCGMTGAGKIYCPQRLAPVAVPAGS
jgi:hypothetical protein